MYRPLFPVAIAATAYAFALTGGRFAILVMFQAAVLLIPVLDLLTSGQRTLKNGNLIRWASVSIVALLTVLANVGKYPFAGTTLEFACVHALGIVGTLFALQWAATTLSPQALLQRVAILLFPLIVLAIVVAFRDGGWVLRAVPFEVHPNWWGELAFAATASALALRSWRLKVPIVGAALVLLLLVQSRGALLAAFVCVVTYAFLSTRLKTLGRGWVPATAILLALLGIAFVLAHSAAWRAWAFLSDTVLLLDDPYRGLETGLTGRVAGWKGAIAIAMDNPILGHGLDTLDKVHNGFLQLLGEGGALLLVVISLLMALAVFNALKTRNYLVVAIVAGYAAYAMTFPRMLNMNVTSMLFYLCLFSWRRTLKPRALEQVTSDSLATPPIGRANLQT